MTEALSDQATALEKAGTPDSVITAYQQMAPLLADVYGLTPQERRVTECVAQGLPTRQIANQLRMSTYTVQDHLKSIFSKTGTGSRGDLVARLFFDQRAMRLTAPPAIPDELRGVSVTARL